MKRAVFLFMLMTGCSQQPVYMPLCAPLVVYTPEERVKMTEELQNMPEQSETFKWVQDYIGLRDSVRALCPQQ